METTNDKLSDDANKEKVLIQKILAGQAGLFELLIKKNNTYLYRIGRSYGYSHEDTQDLMQDTYLDTFKALAKFEHRGSFTTWASRVMVNNCYQRHQRMSEKNEVPTGQEPNDQSRPFFSGRDDTDSEQAVINKEFREVVRDALQHLPLEYRMVFSLRELNGLNVAETAEALGLSPSNVKVRLSRARNLLRQELVKSYSPADIYDFHLNYCDVFTAKVMSRIQALC